MNTTYPLPSEPLFEQKDGKSSKVKIEDMEKQSSMLPENRASHGFRMKSLHFLLLSLAALFVIIPSQAFNPLFNGTMLPYEFSAGDTVAPWNREMKPVKINYVARHGARFLSSEKKIIRLMDYLQNAENERKITEKGKSFLNLIHKVDSATAGRWGALHQIGMEEEQRLSQQMTALCPNLLEKGRIEAEASYVPRVVMTMYEFCHGLSQYSDHLEISTSEGRQFDSLLRYFDTNKEYRDYLENGPWKYAYSNFYEKTIPVEPVAEMANEVVDSHILRDLTLDAYGILQSLDATGIEANPSEWFTESQYKACWEVTNLKHYYQRSVSVFSDLPAQNARPLLNAIKRSIDDSFTRSEGPKVSMWFGHAETVIPLFALMKLPGCYAPNLMPEEVAGKWVDSKISPLGANLMIVSLVDNNGNPFISIRLNGEWIEIDGKKVIPWTQDII